MSQRTDRLTLLPVAQELGNRVLNELTEPVTLGEFLDRMVALDGQHTKDDYGALLGRRELYRFNKFWERFTWTKDLKVWRR